MSFTHESGKRKNLFKGAAAATSLLAATALSGCGESDRETHVYGCPKPESVNQLAASMIQNKTGRRVYNILRTDTGLNRYGAAAVTGLMFVQSDMQPASTNDIGGHGLLGWYGVYWRELVASVPDGETADQIAPQMRFLKDYITATKQFRPRVMHRFATADSPRHAMEAFRTVFEGPNHICDLVYDANSEAADAAYAQ